MVQEKNYVRDVKIREMRCQVPLDFDNTSCSNTKHQSLSTVWLNTCAQQTSTKIHIKSEPLTIISLSAAVSLTKFFAEKSKD